MHQGSFGASESLDTVFHLLPRRGGSVIVQNPVGLNDNAVNGISLLSISRHRPFIPVIFHLKAQLAEHGDLTKDASQPWPDDRKAQPVDGFALQARGKLEGRGELSSNF